MLQNLVLTHPVQDFFLNQLPIQRPYPFLAEIGVAEVSVKVLLREENIILIVFFVGDVVFIQQDAGLFKKRKTAQPIDLG